MLRTCLDDTIQFAWSACVRIATRKSLECHRAQHRPACRLRPDLPRHGTDAGAEHDLSCLPLDLSGADRRARFARWRALGFVVYMLLTSGGITVLLFAVPYAYDVLKIAGALYLAWLAWQALKPAAVRLSSCVTCRQTATASSSSWASSQPAQSQGGGALSLASAAVHRSRRRQRAAQSLVLGFTQIAISVTVNGLIALSAGSIALFLAGRPFWLVVQRWLMGTVLAALAVAWSRKRSARPSDRQLFRSPPWAKA